MTLTDDIKGLKKLGSKVEYQYERPQFSILEVFKNPAVERDYVIELSFPEFTSLCPKTGQPDFATIEIRYVANMLCVESKSLKMYFFAWRNHGAFIEAIVNQILNDFVSVCMPRRCEVRGIFAPRGALKIVVTAEYGGGW